MFELQELVPSASFYFPFAVTLFSSNYASSR